MEQVLQDSTFTTSQIALRLGVALLLGLILGLDRELRRISAGLRTHALVCTSASVITISALDLYGNVRAHGGDADPLRVIQGLAQAIGFIAAGAIFVSRGTVQNLTTAANVWLTTGVGIAAGAGQYRLAVITTAIGVLVVTAMRVLERFVPRTRSDDERR
ncbi:MgtC/SapB family protein [Bradyrhizobium sp. USDA 10063]